MLFRIARVTPLPFSCQQTSERPHTISQLPALAIHRWGGIANAGSCEIVWGRSEVCWQEKGSGVTRAILNSIQLPGDAVPGPRREVDAWIDRHSVARKTQLGIVGHGYCLHHR